MFEHLKVPLSRYYWGRAAFRFLYIAIQKILSRPILDIGILNRAARFLSRFSADKMKPIEPRMVMQHNHQFIQHILTMDL